MRVDLPSLLPLICPACRVRTERGRELHTLSLVATHATSSDGDVSEVEDGALACDNPACGRRYPIVDGIPIVVADAAAHAQRFGAGILEPNLHPETAALMAAAGPDDAPYPWLVEHLSVYLDAHWGDRATPTPDGPSPPFGMSAIAAKLAALPPRGLTVELGASAGRGAWELARVNAGTPVVAPVIAIDLQFAALRRARRLARGQSLAYARRVAGRHYTTATIAAPPATPSLGFVCGDALDPPLVPGAFDRVVALNLVDAVSAPPQLLSVVDGLCAPGGEVILTSPYAWQSGIVLEEHRLGGADPAAAVRRRFTDGHELEARYTVVDEAELPWTLRRDARAATVYRVHWLRAQKSR